LVDTRPGPTDEELLALLLERKILSNAQVEVAKIDSASSGLGSADVLLARKWITEQILSEFYPVSDHAKSQHQTPELTKDGEKSEATPEATYLQNLQKYRQLMTKIMGETY
jgi:hypothetical protein